MQNYSFLHCMFFNFFDQRLNKPIIHNNIIDGISNFKFQFRLFNTTYLQDLCFDGAFPLLTIRVPMATKTFRKVIYCEELYL